MKVTVDFAKQEIQLDSEVNVNGLIDFITNNKNINESKSQWKIVPTIKTTIEKIIDINPYKLVDRNDQQPFTSPYGPNPIWYTCVESNVEKNNVQNKTEG